jgi:hypothetical protein
MFTRKNIWYASGDYVPVPEFVAVILALKSLHDETIVQVQIVSFSLLSPSILLQF